METELDIYRKQVSTSRELTEAREKLDTAIREAFEAGIPVTVIAKAVRIARTQVYRIVR